MRPFAHKKPTDCLVVYSTEASQARRLAEDVCHALYRHNVSYAIAAMNTVDPTICLKDQPDDQTTLIFLVSTAGQGEIPFMARTFFAGLQTALLGYAPKELRSYTIFGLGDSKYPFYNHGAKKFIKRFDKLGLQLKIPPALGDDSHEFGPLGELDIWINDILRALNANELSAEETPYEEGIFTPDVELTTVALPEGRQSKTAVQEVFGMQRARLTANYRVTAADHFQDVRYLEVETRQVYGLGQLLSVWPNVALDRLAPFFVSLQVTDPNGTTARITSNSHPRHPTLNERSLLEIFTQIVDVTSIPSRSFLARLARIMPPGPHRQRLEEMGSSAPDGIQAYVEYVINEKRSIADVVIDFSLGLDRNFEEALKFIILNTPFIVPRKYSIASSPHWHDYQALVLRLRRNRNVDLPVARSIARSIISREMQKGGSPKSTIADLCVAVRKSKTFLQRPLQGLCSTYMASLQPGSDLWIKIEAPPVDMEWFTKQTTQLLLGCGTGVAPLRSLMQHSFISKDSATKQFAVLGFRHPEKDFLFEKEFLDDLKSAQLDIKFAFSRVDESKKKEYIQDTLEQFTLEYKPAVTDSKSAICIAGKSHPMPMQVLDSLSEIAGDRSIISDKRKAGRLIADTWG